jgi:hypothetical protein
MVLYLLGEPYLSGKLGRQLVAIGYSRLGNNRGYRINGIMLYLSDPSQGKVTIEGRSVNELCDNGKKSKNYSRLEQLALIFKPKFIKNDKIQERFKELTRRLN